jgi:hypothetical protein
MNKIWPLTTQKIMEKKTLGVRMFTLKNDNNDSEIE